MSDDNITKHPAADNGPRIKFVKAWEMWVRETAQQLVEATTEEELLNLLAELAVCRTVYVVLCGGVKDEGRTNDE